MAVGEKKYTGRMSSIGRKGGVVGWLMVPGLWLSTRSDLLFPETGEDIPFILENRVWEKPDGIVQMDWGRHFTFRGRIRRFRDVMAHREGACILNTLGRGGQLEVELWPEIRDGALHLTSGRQWFRILGLRLPIPRWLAGEARIREWALDERTLGIQVEIWNPVVGLLFAYEGVMQEMDPQFRS
jgi:hypothetical protein